MKNVSVDLLQILSLVYAVFITRLGEYYAVEIFVIMASDSADDRVSCASCCGNIKIQSCHLYLLIYQPPPSVKIILLMILQSVPCFLFLLLGSFPVPGLIL